MSRIKQLSNSFVYSPLPIDVSVEVLYPRSILPSTPPINVQKKIKETFKDL